MRRLWRQYRLPLLILLVIQGGMSFWYVLAGWGQAGPGFPFDDSWIHAVLARNLAYHGALGFYPGEWTGGTSSLLWVVLLALGYRIGLSATITAVVYGVTCWIITGMCFFILLDEYWQRRRAALIWTLVLVTLGPLIYLALSGMDTLLFLALGLLAAVAYARKQYGPLGVLLALLVLTRLEGLALVGVVALALGVRCRRQALASLLHPLLPPLVALALHGGYNWLVSGHFFPSTMAGRKWLWGFPERLVVLTTERLTSYVEIWRTYLEGWLFHAYALPAPPKGLYQALIWGSLLLGTGVLLASTVLGIRRKALSGLLLLFWWGITHNAIYLLFSPVASIRHQAPNLLLVVLMVSVGWQAADGWMTRRRAWLRFVPAAAALVLALGLLPSAWDWQRAYAAHVQHINQVHVQAGRWIDAHLPPDARVVAFDIGAVTYFGQRFTLDLGGLVDSNFAEEYLWPGRVPDYLKEEGATHLAMVEQDSPLTSLSTKLGLADPSQVGLHLEPLATFRIEPQVPPPFDSLPYYFYLPAYWQITIYRLDFEQP